MAARSSRQVARTWGMSTSLLNTAMCRSSWLGSPDKSNTTSIQYCCWLHGVHMQVLQNCQYNDIHTGLREVVQRSIHHMLLHCGKAQIAVRTIRQVTWDHSCGD
jgi:hypothetical protein